MEEKLNLVTFTVCVNGMVLQLNARSFFADEWQEVQSCGLQTLTDALSKEEMVALDVPSIIALNGKKVKFYVVTDDQGELHIVVGEHTCITGLSPDANFVYQASQDIKAFNPRFFFMQENGAIIERMWDCGAFERVGVLDQYQLDKLL